MSVAGRQRLAVLALAALVAAGCASADRPRERPLVVVSVLPQAWLVERIAGDLVDVEVMIPPGANPSTHEPTMRQMTAMSRATVYFKVGHENFPFERAWIDRLIEERGSLIVVDAAAGIDSRAGDPHIWVSPRRVLGMSRALTAGLEGLMPESAARLQAAERTLREEIDALDAELAATLAPYADRSFLVFHPGWGYFAEDYRLEQVSIEHGSKEPSPAELAELVAGAASAGMTTVFVQPQFSHHAAELLAGEIGAEVVEVDPLARDWADNLRRFAEALRTSFEKAG